MNIEQISKFFWKFYKSFWNFMSPWQHWCLKFFSLKNHICIMYCILSYVLIISVIGLDSVICAQFLQSVLCHLCIIHVYSWVETSGLGLNASLARNVARSPIFTLLTNQNFLQISWGPVRIEDWIPVSATRNPFIKICVSFKFCNQTKPVWL